MRNSTSFFAAAFLSTCVFSCQPTQEPDKEATEKKTIVKSKPSGLNKKVVPYDILALEDADFEQSFGLAYEKALQENLHGRFYDDQASYYIVKEPENTIFDAKVSKLTLFYLHDKLYRSKYELDKDITNQLINTYGKFIIRGFDLENREAIDNTPIVSRKGKYWVLNPLIDNYELTWKLDDRELKIRVNKKEEIPAIHYLESLHEYKKLYKMISRSNS